MNALSHKLIENLTRKNNVPNDVVAKIVGMIKSVDIAKFIGDDVLDRYIIVNTSYKSRTLAKLLIMRNRKQSLQCMVLRGKIKPDEIVEILLNTKMYYDLVAIFFYKYGDKIDKNRFQIYIKKMIGGYQKNRVKYIKLLGSGKKQWCVNGMTIDAIVRCGDREMLVQLYHSGMISHPHLVLDHFYNFGYRELFMEIFSTHFDKKYVYRYLSDLELWRSIWQRGSGLITMLDTEDYLDLVRKSHDEEVTLFFLTKISKPECYPELIQLCLDLEGRIVKARVFDYLLRFNPDLSNIKISPRIILYKRNIELIKRLDELKLDWNREKVVLNFLWNRPKISEIVGRSYVIDFESKWLYDFILNKGIDNDGTYDDWVLYAIGVGDIGMVRNKLVNKTQFMGYFDGYRFEISMQIQLAYHLKRYEVIDEFKRFGWVEDTYRHDIGYLL